MLGSALLTIGLIVVLCISIATWLNTRTIIRDITNIKIKLGIKEEEIPSSFLDKDLDND